MKRLANIGAAFLAIATIGGFYLGAAALHIVWIFWLALSLAIAYGYRQNVRDAVRGAVAYKPLLKRVGELESQLSVAARDEQALRNAATTSYESGMAAGRREVTGLSLAWMLTEVPQLKAVAIYGEDLVLLGTTLSGGELFVGTWLCVVDAGTEEVKGFVAATLIDDDNGVVHLSCVRENVPTFWTALRERARLDSSLPERITLRIPPSDDTISALVKTRIEKVDP